MGKKNRLPGCRDYKCVVNMKNGSISKNVDNVIFHNLAI